MNKQLWGPLSAIADNGPLFDAECICTSHEQSEKLGNSVMGLLTVFKGFGIIYEIYSRKVLIFCVF